MWNVTLTRNVTTFDAKCNNFLMQNETIFLTRNIVSFCVKKLLHFALKSCYILRQKLLHFGLMLHFVSKVVTFCVNCYILRHNSLLSHKHKTKYKQVFTSDLAIRFRKPTMTSHSDSRQHHQPLKPSVCRRF